MCMYACTDVWVHDACPIYASKLIYLYSIFGNCRKAQSSPSLGLVYQRQGSIEILKSSVKLWLCNSLCDVTKCLPFGAFFN